MIVVVIVIIVIIIIVQIILIYIYIHTPQKYNNILTKIAITQKPTNAQTRNLYRT